MSAFRASSMRHGSLHASVWNRRSFVQSPPVPRLFGKLTQTHVRTDPPIRPYGRVRKIGRPSLWSYFGRYRSVLYMDAMSTLRGPSFGSGIGTIA